MTDVVPVTHSLHVGTIVRDRRRALGLRQKDVAAAAGIHYLWLKDLELGRKNPGFANMIRVLTALDIGCALVLRDDPVLCAAPYLKKRLPASFTRRRKGEPKIVRRRVAPS